MSKTPRKYNKYNTKYNKNNRYNYNSYYRINENNIREEETKTQYLTHFKSANYIGTTCALDGRVSKEVEFITGDNKFRIHLKKTKVMDSNQLYITICTIYDNNFVLFRDYDSNNPNYKGQLFSFELRDCYDMEHYSSETYNFLEMMRALSVQDNAYYLLPRRIYRREYYNYLFEFKVNRISPNTIQDNIPMYYFIYFNINISFFKSTNKVKSLEPQRYLLEEKLKSISLSFTQQEFTNFYNLLSYINCFNETNLV